MDFSTNEFWSSLIPALLVLWAGNRILAGKPQARMRFHKGLLLLTSLTLLGAASMQTLLIFLCVMLTAWSGCKLGLRFGGRGRKVLTAVLIPLLLAPLFFYKYGYFVGHSILQQEWDTLRGLIIPIGISFYTFQIIGFCIDTLLRDQAMPTFIDYMNFGSFFPQIVAGPIERREALLPQMQQLDLRIRKDNLLQGIPYIILGLFFKLVMADNLASNFCNFYFTSNAFDIWHSSLNFTFRIYFDFAGYGLTAYGIARCVGITLQMNFLSPYTATNISDFWRRWHISLTGWFRDYIYFPMGGSRTKRWALNIIFVFFVSGIWHGAGWNFMIWGALAGIAMAVHRIFRKRGWEIPGFAGWLLTFVFMVFTWTFFFDTDMVGLGKKLAGIFSADCYMWHDFMHKATHGGAPGIISLPMIALSFIVVFLEYISQKKTQDPYKIFLNPVGCGVMVALLILMAPPVHSQFIYFAF